MEEECLVLETFERKGPESVTKAYEQKGGRTHSIPTAKRSEHALKQRPTALTTDNPKEHACFENLKLISSPSRPLWDIQPHSDEPLVVVLAPDLTAWVSRGPESSWGGF